MSKDQWEKYRNSRIVSKKIINILISNIKLKYTKEKIEATFTQNYKSGRLNQTSNKKLIFIKEDGEWFILQEISE